MSGSVGTYPRNRGRRLRLWCGAGVALTGIALGCGGREDVVIVRPPAVAAPMVPAGATFEVVLEHDLGPQVSEPGDLVTARLARPLRAAEETIVVPAGSIVLGRVLDVDREQDPSITIRFETIVSETEAHAIAGRVLSAGRGVAIWNAPSGDAPEIGHSVIRPLDLPGDSAVGGGPPARREVLLPAGTPLLVMLLRPVVYPSQ